MAKFLGLLFSFVILTSNVFANDMRFVQVSDVNFSTVENNMLQKAIIDINKQKNVEFVVFTGDNIEKPSKEYLEGFLKEAKKLNCPFYIALGEHDVNKHKDLSKIQYMATVKKNVKKYKQDKINYIFEKNNIIFILLDGSKDVIPSTNGFYKSETIFWLDKQLSENQTKNVFIFQHFPIVPPCPKESYYTYKTENYFAVLKKYGNVKAIFSGHFGVNKEENLDGITHVTTRGLPTYRIIDIIDYESDSPIIWTTLKEVQ